ncbi:MAG TPA: T9SS type A sorting domain-containing protein [Flavisolibacter sp.]|nr:T9SS type A sorting domain-containing protein [Flavisolibacter sp.]
MLVPPEWLFRLNNSEVNKKEPGSELQVSVMPNPSSNSFTLVTQSNSVRLLSLRISNTLGNVIESRTGIAPNSAVQVGGSYPIGVYYAEVIQGGRRVVVKLIKRSWGNTK